MTAPLPRPPLVRRRMAVVLLAVGVGVGGGLPDLEPTPVMAGGCDCPAYPHRLVRRPRPPHPAPPRPPDNRENFVNLKFGTYDPEGHPDAGGFFGLTTGIEFQNRVTVGFTLDYHRRSFIDETVIAESVDQNGNVIITTVRRVDTSSNLIPLGVALGLRLPGSRTLTPFVGAGVAYEILVNDVENHELGIRDTNVYTGPGWQLFGGLMVPVTSEVRLLGELWTNNATVRRDIDRYELGLPVSEKIDAGGFGARLGVEFHFD